MSHPDREPSDQKTPATLPDGLSREAEARAAATGLRAQTSGARLQQTIGNRAVLQMLQRQRSPGEAAAMHHSALAGVQGLGARLPHFEAIQRAFGEHDVSRVRAFTGGRAATANRFLAAAAYTVGDRVAFASGSPDLHTAAHEAAHTIQQRSGVELADGVGTIGDRHERHADAVAERVVRGESAAPLLDAYPCRQAAVGPAAAVLQGKFLNGNQEAELDRIAQGAIAKIGEHATTRMWKGIIDAFEVDADVSKGADFVGKMKLFLAYAKVGEQLDVLFDALVEDQQEADKTAIARELWERGNNAVETATKSGTKIGSTEINAVGDRTTTFTVVFGMGISTLQAALDMLDETQRAGLVKTIAWFAEGQAERHINNLSAKMIAVMEEGLEISDESAFAKKAEELLTQNTLREALKHETTRADQLATVVLEHITDIGALDELTLEDVQGSLRECWPYATQAMKKYDIGQEAMCTAIDRAVKGYWGLADGVVWKEGQTAETISQ